MIVVKPNVSFDVIAPAGFRLLTAIDTVSRIYNPLTVTSACDGEHSGSDDPHKRGEAYDVRSHDFDDATKRIVLVNVMMALEDGEPVAQDTGGYVTEHFFGWIEQAGTRDEHMHFQLRRGAALPS